MHVDTTTAAERLAATAATIRALVEPVAAEQARWKPEPGQWSILEVVNHLADEEVEDFRTRLRLVLEDPGQPWPPIDPEGWPAQRRYHERELGESLDRFLRERENSIAWLGTLAPPDWERSHDRPGAGRLSAGSLLGSWLAHDLLHIRQLTRLHYGYLVRQVEPHSIRYAGQW